MGQPVRVWSKGMKDNFINFPPLGVVLVGMLGIGVAEKSGLIGAASEGVHAGNAQGNCLTPAMVFRRGDEFGGDRRGVCRAAAGRGALVPVGLDDRRWRGSRRCSRGCRPGSVQT